MKHGECRKALIVGINDYPKSKLSACENDAREMHRLLQHHGKGDPNFECKLLLNAEATAGALQQQIEILFKGNPDVALFYFSGHGRQDKTSLYLVTPDGDQNSSVDVEWMLRKAHASDAKEVVIILDCCYAGEAGNQYGFERETAQLRKGFTIMAATASKEVAEERSRHGKFTGWLCRGLNGAAADLVGHVTTASLYAYVDSFLSSWEQRPIYKAFVSGLIPLRYCLPKTDKKYLRQVVNLFPVAHDAYNFSVATTNREHVKVLKELRRHGLVETSNGKTIAQEVKLGGACRLTLDGVDIHTLVSKHLI